MLRRWTHERLRVGQHRASRSRTERTERAERAERAECTERTLRKVRRTARGRLLIVAAVRRALRRALLRTLGAFGPVVLYETKAAAVASKARLLAASWPSKLWLVEAVLAGAAIEEVARIARAAADRAQTLVRVPLGGTLSIGAEKRVRGLRRVRLGGAHARTADARAADARTADARAAEAREDAKFGGGLTERVVLLLRARVHLALLSRVVRLGRSGGDHQRLRRREELGRLILR